MADSLIRRVSTRVSRVRFGGPTGVTTLSRAASDGIGQWRLAVAADSTPRADPRRLGEGEADLKAMLEPMPDLGVLAIPNGSIVGPHGWVFTADAACLGDASWHGPEVSTAHLPRAFPGRPRKLGGAILSIASDFAQENYGHFLLDCLPRLDLAQRAGFSMDDFDHVYLPRPPTKSATFVLDAMGVPESKRLWASDHPFVTADTVVATSFPGARRNYARFVPQFLRGRFAAGAGPRRRIYVPRDGVRRIRNEAELVEIAAGFGIEVYDFRDHASEPGFFANVELVVGAHGASLANVAFCPPGAKVLELIPSDHVHPYYYTLSESGGLSYGYILGRSVSSRGVGAWGPSPYDFDVDAGEFRRALQALLP